MGRRYCAIPTLGRSFRTDSADDFASQRVGNEFGFVQCRSRDSYLLRRGV